MEYQKVEIGRDYGTELEILALLKEEWFMYVRELYFYSAISSLINKQRRRLYQSELVADRLLVDCLKLTNICDSTTIPKKFRRENAKVASAAKASRPTPDTSGINVKCTRYASLLVGESTSRSWRGGPDCGVSCK